MVKVLLVDDDKELCAMQAEYLAGDGFAVVCAHDGETGAAAALGGTPDGPFAIVVLDVMMPRVNGIDYRSEQSRNDSDVRYRASLIDVFFSIPRDSASLDGITVTKNRFRHLPFPTPNVMKNVFSDIGISAAK